MCIQLPDCCDENPAENVCTDVVVCDPDCGDDAALAKVVLYGFGEDVEKGDPIACFTAEDLVCGVDICGYGTLTLMDGKLCFDVNEENQDLKQLKDGEKFTIAFGAFAFDGDCYSEQDCFNIDIKGGNDGPTDGDELCEDGTAPEIGENGQLCLGDMNLLLNASDPENDPLHVSAVAKPVVTVNGVEGLVTVSAFDPTDPFTYTLTGASGTSKLTIDADGNVTLKEETGKGAFDFMDDGDKAKISFDYTVSDGKCTDDSKAEICINGEDDNNFYIPSGFSNIFLYMLDPNAEWESGDATDKGAVVKLAFDQGSGSLPALDTDGDGYVSLSEINDYIANDLAKDTDGDPNTQSQLGTHTELIALSVHNGNFVGETPYNTGYEPNDGTNIGNTNGSILKSGEGQLVFLDGQGFEVEMNNVLPPVPASDDLTAANAWLDSLQHDVVFSPQLAGQASYTSSELAGTILDPATALGAAILANTPI
jgi:VCBS repeat-containing protein